jgi:hypothetical protein
MFCHFVTFFTPYMLYKRISKTKYFFTEKKFRFLQSAIKGLLFSKLHPKYFRNIPIIKIYFFQSAEY